MSQQQCEHGTERLAQRQFVQPSAPPSRKQSQTHRPLLAFGLDAATILLVVALTTISWRSFGFGWPYEAVGLMAAASLWWRRTHPAWVLGIGLVTAIASVPFTGTVSDSAVVVAFALYTLARQDGPGRAGVALAISWLLAAAAMVVWADARALDSSVPGESDSISDSEFTVITVVLLAVLWSLLVLAGASLRENRRGPSHAVDEDLVKRGPIRRFFRAHPWLMDIVVVLFYAVSNSNPAAGFSWLLVACLIAGGVALMCRRHFPISVVVALLVLMTLWEALLGEPTNIDIGLAFALYAVITVRGAKLGWAAFALTAIVAILGAFLWAIPQPNTGPGAGLQLDRGTYISGIVASQMVVWLVAVAIGMNVRSRREQISRLVFQARQYRLERDQREMIAASAERARIAREMHDVIAHSLSVMIALADGAGASMAKNPQQTSQALTELASTGRAALADTRRILGMLRTEPTEAETEMVPQPGPEDLEELIERFRNAGVEVELQLAGAAVPADPNLQLTIYRVVQEGLTNALRYAPGAAIDVSIEVASGAIAVIVSNTAPPSPSRAGQGSGHGLIGIRQRAAVYNGVVEAGPTEHGWRLAVFLRPDSSGTAPTAAPAVAPTAAGRAEALESTERPAL